MNRKATISTIGVALLAAYGFYAYSLGIYGFDCNRTSPVTIRSLSSEDDRDSLGNAVKKLDSISSRLVKINSEPRPAKLSSLNPNNDAKEILNDDDSTTIENADTKNITLEVLKFVASGTNESPSGVGSIFQQAVRANACKRVWKICIPILL